MSRTIGVAVPVPEPFGSLLRDARASFGDPMAATVPTHITLMPPIDVDDDPELLKQNRMQKGATTSNAVWR